MRGTRTNEGMSETLKSGEDVQQAANSSRCNGLVPWNFFHGTGTALAFHHKAMHVVAAPLMESGKVPGLRHLRLWTDGHSSTYEGLDYFFSFPLSVVAVLYCTS